VFQKDAFAPGAMTNRPIESTSASAAREVCVVGAGIIGSWTALHLAEAGARATLVEQFPLPHTRGSSHGQSRAFRFLGDDELDRLEYSLERWQTLEREGSEPLFVRTGLLNFGPEGDPYLDRYMAVVRDGGRPCAWLDHAAVVERFPTLRYPEEWGAAWDPNGGILFAHRCVHAVQRRFRELGGRVVTARVTSLEPRAAGVRIELRSHDDTEVRPTDFDAVVVCAGPWSGRLVPDLASLLRTVHTPVTYWRDTTGAHDVAHGFPILFNARLTDMYGLPACEYPGLVKVLFHGGPDADPDGPDPDALAPYVARVRAYVAEHLPGLDARRPAIQESCFYTMTPDGMPIVDRLASGVVVGAGFSGSGFKHSPATGRMLAALALGREERVPSGFAFHRYALKRGALRIDADG
jgi:sarcosine oxidase/L-pipecolate oxidase